MQHPLKSLLTLMNVLLTKCVNVVKAVITHIFAKIGTTSSYNELVVLPSVLSAIHLCSVT